MLAANLPHFAHAFSQSMISAKALHWLCSGQQQECKQAPMIGGLTLSLTITSLKNFVCHIPKGLDPPLLTVMRLIRKQKSSFTRLMRQKKIARNWNNILYFHQQRNRVGKIVKCAWSIYRMAPLKSLSSSNLSILPRILRQELPPHDPQGRNQLLIKSENVTEMW